ncbi:hypothetical protein Zmor_008211 [Zophobas morio]|uniref:Uncharacterized protein n=1 Tax=Zophobas morio TaxID=2755281 RepID=A0AA38J3T7_9CUCU|nr:hypothetical protein Zmor_008211 [Zophobas morio]
MRTCLDLVLPVRKYCKHSSWFYSPKPVVKLSKVVLFFHCVVVLTSVVPLYTQIYLFVSLHYTNELLGLVLFEDLLFPLCGFVLFVVNLVTMGVQLEELATWALWLLFFRL